MLRWILSVFFGCIVLNIIIQTSAVPNWKSNVNRRLFDDCHQCHARNQELERRIQTLEANIREHILDTPLQERLLQATTQSILAESSDQGGSRVVPSPIRSNRQDNSGTDYSGCVPYPDYANSSQCTICGGKYGLTCQGRCQREINDLCKLYIHVSRAISAVCPEVAVCIDCSDVSATTRHLEQVPCPPDGYSDLTEFVVLLLDNNHLLNLTNAFNTGYPYSNSVGGISLSNTTLDGSQFNFNGMYIFDFNMSSATISGEMNSDAFQGAHILGDFDMSSANISGGISDHAFHAASIDGNFDMSSATVYGGISGFAFASASINSFNMSSACIFGSITNSSFTEASIGSFNMNSVTISGGISNRSFAKTEINGNFDMSSATISGGISGSPFELVYVSNNFNMSRANISGGISMFLVRTSISGNFDMSSATISGGVSNAAFFAAFFFGDFDMSFVTISGGITQYAFETAYIKGNFDMSSAIISGGITNFAFEAANIYGNFDVSSATISGGITNFGWGGLSIFGNLLFTDTTFHGDIQASSFAGTTVEGFFNASGARFSNDTLPIQMLSGLQVQKGVDLSHCKLKTLEHTRCASDGCFGDLHLIDFTDETLLKIQGGPFTGMAMPVGIASTFIDLSHNNLTEISNTSLLGITATTLDLSHNQIAVFHPFWFLGAPDAKFIVTTGNPSACEKNQINSTSTEAYTYQETATITCNCSSDTRGTGNFCAKQNCNQTLQSLNVYSRAYLGGGYYKSHGDVVLSGDTTTLQCPAGKHPNSDSAVSARCLGGAFEPQTNECVTTSWFTPGRIAGIVFGVLIIAAIIGYVVFLSPEKRKGKFFQNEVELKKRLLHDTNCDLEEATALNTRMRGAWKIEETDVQLGLVVASGAFGVVHDAKFGGLRVAVKVLKQPLDEELYPDVGIDFTRECETLMAIRHACLLIFYGAGLTSENRPFIVTEFMSRGSLKKMLADPRQELGWPLRLKFAQQIAKGMEYLHNANIIHRDLKSDNCLVNYELDVKVCDFGTSKFLTAARPTFHLQDTEMGTGDDSLALSTTMTKGVGTMLWMAPELFLVNKTGTNFKRKHGQEVDMYSYGMIMWELLTREVPWSEIKKTNFFKFQTALTIALENDQRPQIPVEARDQHPQFVALMIRCWETIPESRPTFAGVVEMLG